MIGQRSWHSNPVYAFHWISLDHVHALLSLQKILSPLRLWILTKDPQPRLQCDTGMLCQGNFNWQDRFRVRIKVKDIGLGFGLMSGLLAHLAKIPQIFCNFNYTISITPYPTYRMMSCLVT